MIKIDKKQIFRYTAVIVLLVFLYFIGLLKPIENMATRYLNPLIGRLQQAGTAITRLYSVQTGRTDLAGQVRELQGQVNTLTVENARLQSLDEENKVLREQLGFFTKNKSRYVMANVISRGNIADSSGQIETFLIDKGNADGVRADLAVLSSDGIIIGKVMEVKSNLASVYLTNNARCKLAATILSQTNTAGIASGELGLTIKMDFIPQTVNINKDDLVITSGLEQYIPRGLTIGRVLSVDKENNELWQTATIEPLVDPSNLNIVSVIIP